MRPFFCNKCDVLVNPVTDAEGHTIAEAVIGTGRIHKEVIQRTTVDRQLNRHILRAPLCTTLHTSGKTDAVVAAVTNVDSGTNEPIKVASDGEYPMIGDGQVDVVVGVVAETEVKLQTVGVGNVVLVRQLGTITGSVSRSDTAKAAADVLCVGSKGQA